VVSAHIDDDILTEDGKVEVGRVNATGRLAGNWYATTEDRFRMERPP